jgi:hypothetical protein
MLPTRGVAICSDCVALCQRILTFEPSRSTEPAEWRRFQFTRDEERREV